MSHPLIGGARWRFACIARIDRSRTTDPTAGFASRTAQLGNSVPLVLAALADPTALYFYQTCVRFGLQISWVSHDDLATGAIEFHDLMSATVTASGIYLREPIQQSTSEIAVGSAIRAAAQAAANLISPSFLSTNWSKPLHVAILRTMARGRVRLPHTRVVSVLRSDDVGVVKGLGSLPTLARSAEEITPVVKCGPILLQERIRGQEARLHIIDGEAFACTIESTALDYRTSTTNTLRTFNPGDWELPVLSDIIAAEGLRFAGLDIIRTDDALYLLEVNPSPGYHSYERAVDPERAGITCALYAALTATASDQENAS